MDLFSRTPTFHDTDAAYILPNEKVPPGFSLGSSCLNGPYYQIRLIVQSSPVEHARLLDQHNSLVALVKGRIVHAPVSSPDTVIDVGCGTGIVTRCLSSHFPTARLVYGIDLCPVPIQPGDDKASNLNFICGNFRKLAESDARFPPESVDYVFSRLLLCGMTDWPGYVRDAFRVLKPGGWAEMSDYVENMFYTDDRIAPHVEWEWLRSIRAGGASKGLDLDAGLNIYQYMKDAGFVDIQRWEYRVPCWRSAGDERPETRPMTEHIIGDKWGLYWHMLPKLLDGMGYSQEDVEKLRMDMRRGVAEEEGKEVLFCVTIGRKPDKET